MEGSDMDSSLIWFALYLNEAKGKLMTQEDILWVIGLCVACVGMMIFLNKHGGLK
jgi:hypothetical protein